MVLKLAFTTLTLDSGKNLTAVPVEVIIEPVDCTGFVLTSVINVSTLLWLQLTSIISCWSAILDSLFASLPIVRIGSLIYPLPAFVIVILLISLGVNIASAVALPLIVIVGGSV